MNLPAFIRRFAVASLTVLFSALFGFLLGDARKIFGVSSEGVLLQKPLITEVSAQGSKDLDPGCGSGCSGCDGSSGP